MVDFACCGFGLCCMGLHHQGAVTPYFLKHTALVCDVRRVMGLEMTFQTSNIWQAACAVVVVLTAVIGTVPASATTAGYLEPTLHMDPPKAARELCAQYDWACAGQGGSVAPSSETERALITEVNRRVNTSVRAVSDRRQYGHVDYWTLPSKAGGDCEDYALLKKKELIRLGLDPAKLLLATVLDHSRTPHAVLIYRSSKGDFLLDNLTDDVIDWRASAYIFLRMQNPEDPRRWVGGFRPR